MECKAGDAVFRKGERVNGIYFIKHGKVKIISSGINNDDQIVRVVGNGHIFGHRGAGGIYPFSAIALSDITICFIDNDSFYNVYINNPQFSLEIMKVHSR